MSEESLPGPNVHSAAAIFQVSDLSAAIAFYTELLHFRTLDIYGEPPYYARLELEAAPLHLNSIESNRKRLGLGSIYIYCRDVDAYHDSLDLTQINLTSPLETYSYGMRDFQVADPDGNLLGFGMFVPASSC